MKNRIRKFNLEDTLKNIAKRHTDIFNPSNLADTVGVELMGKCHLDENGDADPEHFGYIEIRKFKEFMKFKEKDDFSIDDIPYLMENLIPHLLRIKDEFKDDEFKKVSGGTIKQRDLYAGIFGEGIGDIPINRYFARHHKNANNDAQAVKECIALAETLLKAIDTISDEDIKAFAVDALLASLLFLLSQKEQGDFKGADVPDGTRGYTDEQLKEYEDTFKRIKELPQDGVYRRRFVCVYIDEEVYNRFYMPKEKEAGRIDTDEEGDPYTIAGAKEWDDHFNALCEEYGFPEYKRNRTDDYYNQTLSIAQARNGKLYNYISGGFEEEKDHIKILAKQYGIDPALIDRALYVLGDLV